MSFEKKMKKRANKKLDEFAKNPYHTNPNHHFPLWGKVLIPTLSFSFALVIGLSVFVPMMKTKGVKNANDSEYSAIPTQEKSDIDGGDSAKVTPAEGSNKNYSAPKGNASDDLVSYQDHYIPEWMDKTIVQKYPTFSYDKATYAPRDVDYITPLDINHIGEKISDISVNGFDIYEQRDYVNEAEIYAINNIAHDAALAIKFEGTTEYYPYINSFCTFASLEELVNKLGFNQEVEFVYINYSYQENNNTATRMFKDIDKTKVMEILFDDLSITTNNPLPRYQAIRMESSEGQYSSPTQPMSYENNFAICVAIEALEITNGGMYLYENGSLLVNILGRQYTYQLGDERYNSLKDYLLIE